MNEQGRFPFRFCVITFAWAWLTWLPLVPGYRGIGPVGEDTVVALTMPLALLIAAFGPGLLVTLSGKRRAVSPEMALRLSRLFGNSPEFWLNAQRAVDLWEAGKRIREDVRRIRALSAA